MQGFSFIDSFEQLDGAVAMNFIKWKLVMLKSNDICGKAI